MGSRGCALVVAAASLLVVSAPASAAPSAATVTCANASQGRFAAATLRPARTLVFGPFSMVGAVGYTTLDLPALRRVPWIKTPFLLARGRRASIAIAPSHRDTAGWVVGGHDAGRTAAEPLRGTVSTVRFRACSKTYASRKSLAGDRVVTFWSGGLAVSELPQCVPFTVRIDGGRAQRHTLALGRPCG